MSHRKSERHRCLTVGCNPKLKNRAVAENHASQTGHRIARWPVRSEEGKRKQRERNLEQAMEHVRLAVGDAEFYEENDPGWDGHKEWGDDE